jgi:hypothetical protein
MRTFATLCEINDPFKLSLLKRKLCALAETYVFELEFSIPQSHAAKAGVLYRDKIKWLSKNINAPALHLRESLSGENLPWLSLFPNLTARSPYPAFYKIQEHLQELLEWSAALERSVDDLLKERGEKRMPAGRPITDLRYALAYDLVATYAETTDKIPSLVTKATSQKGRSSITDSNTLTFVRSVAQIILGDQSSQMVDETRTAISKHKQTLSR